MIDRGGPDRQVNYDVFGLENYSQSQKSSNSSVASPFCGLSKRYKISGMPHDKKEAVCCPKNARAKMSIMKRKHLNTKKSIPSMEISMTTSSTIYKCLGVQSLILESFFKRTSVLQMRSVFLILTDL